MPLLETNGRVHFTAAVRRRYKQRLHGWAIREMVTPDVRGKPLEYYSASTTARFAQSENGIAGPGIGQDVHGALGHQSCDATLSPVLQSGRVQAVGHKECFSTRGRTAWRFGADAVGLPEGWR